MVPAVNQVKLTKPQRKFVGDISDTMMKMMQSPVTMAYSSSDSSSVVLLGKLPTSEKKSSGPEVKSVVGDNQSQTKSIMSIGSFGEELYKLKTHLVAEQKRREEKGSADGAGPKQDDSILIQDEETAARPTPNIDSDLYEAMKDAMDMDVAGPSLTAAATVASVKKDVVGNETAITANVAAVHTGNWDKECDQKSSSQSHNHSSHKQSQSSAKNETSCSCQSDAEP